MSTYRDMYYKMAAAMANAIDLLQIAMQECEEIYETSIDPEIIAEDDPRQSR